MLPATQILPPEEGLPVSAAAQMVLNGEPGQILAFGGIDGDALRAELQGAEPEPGQRLALFTRLDPHPRPEQIVEQVLKQLRLTASAMWPLWFTDVHFADLGEAIWEREALRDQIRGAVRRTPTISQGWTEAAMTLARAGQSLRIVGIPPEIELRQLCLAVQRAGLSIVTPAPRSPLFAAAFVHALEWIARTAPAAVIVLFDRVPVNDQAFDRILYGAQTFAPPLAPKKRRGDGFPANAAADSWLLPIVGRPRPLDESEQRLAKALSRDREMAHLFAFNQFVSTIFGSRAKAALVWTVGRVVVEIDDYTDRVTRRAFRDDRHRDYELTISGYTILRLTKDDIAEDLEKSIEKIRDVVNLRPVAAIEPQAAPSGERNGHAIA